MSRRLAGFTGTSTAIALLLGAWTAGFCLLPQHPELRPQSVFLSDNKFVGWRSPVEQACRHFPAIHQYLWPPSPFC